MVDVSAANTHRRCLPFSGGIGVANLMSISEISEPLKHLAEDFDNGGKNLRPWVLHPVPSIVSLLGTLCSKLERH